MSYKVNFLKILLRVLLLITWIFGMAYTYFQTDLSITPIMLGLLTLFSTVELVWFLQKQERNWVTFLESVRYQDFNRVYQKKASKELSEAYELISKGMEDLQTKNQSKYRLMQTLLGHISIGVMCYQEGGDVVFTNKSFDQLLELPGLINIEKLKRDYPAIYEVVTHQEFISSEWVDHKNGQKLLVKSESFSLRGIDHTLISLTDIRSSLDTKELESYQKLMSVMTHEIMNSTNPILSLIRVINKKMINGDQLNTLDKKDQNNTVTSLEAIEERTSGILKFVSAYKEINKSIQPHIEQVKSEDLLSSITTLMDQSKSIQFHIKDELKDDLLIDSSLINQVLINLVKNAMEVLSATENSLITISLRKEKDSSVIEVMDNGPGVANANIHQIFIPFYTTKLDGSGIGLALSRKIIKAHGGTLEYDRLEDQTRFIVRLPGN